MSRIISKNKILAISVIAIVFILGAVLSFNFAIDSTRRIMWTNMSINLLRMNIDKYKELAGNNPESLAQMKKFIDSNATADFHRKNFKEFVSDKDGNSSESAALNGSGGWYYDKQTATLKVNLNKSTGSYLPVCFTDKRNQPPSDW